MITTTTVDPLGKWHDRPNLGNGYTWVSNGYRNAWDPLGLEKGKKKDDPWCACKKPYVLFIVDDNPFTKAKAEGKKYNRWKAPGDNKKIKNIISKMKAKVKKAGYLIKTLNPYDTVKEEDSDKKEAEKVKDWKKKLKDKHLKSPCIMAIVFIGHGGKQGGLKLGYTPDSVLTNVDINYPSSLKHPLKWMFFGYCYSGKDMKVHKEESTAGEVSDKDDPDNANYAGNSGEGQIGASTLEKQANAFKVPAAPKDCNKPPR